MVTAQHCQLLCLFDMFRCCLLLCSETGFQLLESKFAMEHVLDSSFKVLMLCRSRRLPHFS